MWLFEPPGDAFEGITKLLIAFAAGCAIGKIAMFLWGAG